MFEYVIVAIRNSGVISKMIDVGTQPGEDFEIKEHSRKTGKYSPGYEHPPYQVFLHPESIDISSAKERLAECTGSS